MNFIQLVGRIVEKPILQNNYEDNTKETTITLAVNRSYKDKEGYYNTDFFTIKLENQLAEKCCEYCKKGDIIGIVGRLENRFTEDKRKYDIIIAQKLTFITTSKIEADPDANTIEDTI